MRYGKNNSKSIKTVSVMSKVKLIQYLHRPNMSELGKGNVHETYLLINSDLDMSNLFPIGVEVNVKDSNSGNIYHLKSAQSREFRINQMGPLYRDYDVHYGDDVLITGIRKGNQTQMFVQVDKHYRVVITTGSKGSELVNVERLKQYQVGLRQYELHIKNGSNNDVCRIEFDAAKPKRSDSPETTDYYKVTINDNRIPNGTYMLDLDGDVTLIKYDKFSYNEVNFDDETLLGIQGTQQEHSSSTDLPSVIQSYLTAIRTKPFLLLAGISGTGKSRIVRKLAQATMTEALHKAYNPKYEGDFEKDRWTMHAPENFQIIQVKPNWHNSMDVVGFKSNIGKESHYEFTPFVEFIAKAWHHTDIPFFLCLDEMNLAPVEEYFAEFLSAIESRSKNEDGQYETDPIVKPFDDFGMEVCGQMIGHLINSDMDEGLKLENQFRKKGLTLPPNLIVMGTVNMDETTFSFSRKVLDRAMSIEMNKVNYDDFLNGKTEDDVPVLIDNNLLLVDRPIKSEEVKADIESDKVMEYLKAVNTILEGTPFKLGYRAANEALLYVAAAKVFNNENLASALDDFTLMKILSRIEGDDTKLKVADREKQVEPELGDDLFPHLRTLFTKTFADLTECKSLIKLKNMTTILERDHFVSFWG